MSITLKEAFEKGCTTFCHLAWSVGFHIPKLTSRVRDTIQPSMMRTANPHHKTKSTNLES